MLRSHKGGWLYFGTLARLLLGFGMADLFGMALVQVSVPPCGLCNIEAVVSSCSSCSSGSVIDQTSGPASRGLAPGNKRQKHQRVSVMLTTRD